MQVQQLDKQLDQLSDMFSKTHLSTNHWEIPKTSNKRERGEAFGWSDRVAAYYEAREYHDYLIDTRERTMTDEEEEQKEFSDYYYYEMNPMDGQEEVEYEENERMKNEAIQELYKTGELETVMKNIGMINGQEDNYWEEQEEYINNKIKTMADY